MIKTFIKERPKWNELVQVDMKSQKVKIYCTDKEYYLGFPFSEYFTTVKKMGYKSINDFLNHLKTDKKEIETNKQRAKEIDGLLALVKHRIKNKISFNDIVERLVPYGIETREAIKKIEDFVDYGILKHNIKVTYSDGTIIETEVNGTIREIEEYYSIGSTFNVGTVNDNMQEVVHVEFLI